MYSVLLAAALMGTPAYNDTVQTEVVVKQTATAGCFGSVSQSCSGGFATGYSAGCSGTTRVAFTPVRNLVGLRPFRNLVSRVRENRQERVAYRAANRADRAAERAENASQRAATAYYRRSR